MDGPFKWKTGYAILEYYILVITYPSKYNWLRIIKITFVHLGETETPSFVLVEERSLNGSPSIVVTFPDGYQDTLVLSKFYANEQNRMASKERCHYIGHLQNENTACVAMTGCVGSQDVQFTILSKHSPKSSTFKWTKDGNIENMKVFLSLINESFGSCFFFNYKFS